MIVVRFDTALYVRTPWFNRNLDKVLRLRVGAGPVDFISEHIIFGGASMLATGTAYGQATIILRNGSDEAPPALIDGVWHGGNHPGLSYYNMQILLDDELVATARGNWNCNSLKIIESYGIPTDAAIAGKTADPLRAYVTIERNFGTDGFCRYKYTLVAMRQLELSQLTTMQAFRPIVLPGQTLMLVVPGSNLKNGVNVASEITDRFLPPEDWDDPAVPPAYFAKELRTNNIPQWAFAMGFDAGLDRGTLTTACHRSAAGKFYPRAFEGPVTMMPGEQKSFSGFFGSYNRLGN